MARKPGSSPSAIRGRAAKTAAATAPGSPLAEETKKKTNPVQFFREVRQEARKITWTSRKETWITSVMVGIMVVIAAVFFFATDSLLAVSVNYVLKLASPG